MSRSSTTGLACAGGVVEGAIYEVGALHALEEAIEGTTLNDLDIYVGVSSGALIGSFLANGVSTTTLRRAIVSQAEPALNLRPEVLFTPAFREYAGRLGRLPETLLSTARGYAQSPTDLSLLGLLTTFGAMMPTGLFNNAPLERFIARAFATGGRTNDFRRLPAMLRVVTMHLDSAEVACFGEPGRDHVPISKAVQASTALPGLYCPVEIDGEHYIDGVARRTVHASVALEAGADLLFCVNPIVPVNLQLKQQVDRLFGDDSIADHGLPSVLSQTFRSIIDSRMKTGFKKYEHTFPDADLILIEPELEDTSLFFSNIFSFKNRHDVSEHAYQATRRYLRAEADRLAPMLKRHGLRLRRDVLADTTRTLHGSTALDRADPVSPETAGPSARTDRPAGLAGGDGLPADSTAPPVPAQTSIAEEANAVLDRLDQMLDRLEQTTRARKPSSGTT
jgi:predicted acylesterase/phospholipase RssA